MNKTFTLFQNGRLERVSINEDDYRKHVITATKTLEAFKASGNKYAVRDVIYSICTHSWDRYADGYAYNWIVTQSQYSDNSRMGGHYRTSETLGSAIRNMIEDGFIIEIDGVVLTNL